MKELEELFNQKRPLIEITEISLKDKEALLQKAYDLVTKICERRR